MDIANVRWPQSLWAAATPSGPDLPELEGSAQADVIVIGAGFTGLSTALHLREAGIDVAIVEAMEPGWGASGRNNGQVIPTLSRPDPDDIVARHGAAGEHFVALLRDSASTLFDLVRRYQIQAEQEQAGWVQPVHSSGRIRIAERRVRQWSKLGAAVELLSREQTRQMLGSDAWFGGFAPGAVAVAWMGYDDPRSLGEGESGGGLALPIWIDSVARMLRGVAVRPLVDYLPPDGLVMVGSDWRYSEWAEGGFVPRVGSAAETPVAAGVAASAPPR